LIPTVDRRLQAYSFAHQGLSRRSSSLPTIPKEQANAVPHK